MFLFVEKMLKNGKKNVEKKKKKMFLHAYLTVKSFKSIGSLKVVQKLEDLTHTDTQTEKPMIIFKGYLKKTFEDYNR
jgi:hypothetical protein